MSLLEVCQWLETTWLAELVTLSMWGFHVLVTVHLLSLGLSAGMIVWMDLRLLGRVLPACPVPEVYRRLAPWALTGFAGMFISGGILFVGYAGSAYGNTWFRIKMVAILVAGINAVAYHVFTSRRVAALGVGESLPSPARATGLISITAWAIVVMAGRMMSYTMF